MGSYAAYKAIRLEQAEEYIQRLEKENKELEEEADTLCEEVLRLRTELDVHKQGKEDAIIELQEERRNISTLIRWAQGASHHNLCRKSMYMPSENQRCTCGRDQLELLKRDRGAKPSETPRDFDANDDANDGSNDSVKGCTEGRCSQVDDLLSKLLTISIDK